MHIALFNRAFHPEISATSQLLTELADDLAHKHGCRVSIVTGIPQGACSEAWIPPKQWSFVHLEHRGPIRVLRARGTSWPKRNLPGRIANYLTYFFSACLASFQLERPDVVIALTDPPIIGLAALWVGLRHSAPVVISYRDLFPEVSRLVDGRRRPLIEWALHRVNRILIRRSNQLVALGEAMRDRLILEKGAPPDKVLVIPDWTDTSLILPGPKDNRFSRAHGLADRFVVMHSGNVGGAQDLDTLLRAASELRDLPRLVFAIVGEGVRKAHLQAEVSRMGLANVRFFPFQPQERLSDSFASADCFLVSTRPGLAGYVTPSKLYGILAAGRAYVAAVDEQCDVARITRRFECGLLVPAGDSKRLAEQIKMLYNDAVLAQRLGAKARQAALSFDRAGGVLAYYRMCCELTGRT